MKSFAIVSKKDEVSKKACQDIKERLISNGINFNEEKPELIIVVGGDGTFLSAVRKYIDIIDDVYFVAIHNGTLGFFADYRFNQIDEFLNDVVTKQPHYEEKRLLEATFADQKILAVNEFAVQSSQTNSIDVYIDGDKLENFHGTGLIVSSQAGSSAYSRSVGGAVVAPGLEIMQLCELAGIHHIRYHSLINPLIVDGASVIKMSCANYKDTKLCYDRWDIQLKECEDITFKLSQHKVRLAHYRERKWISHLEQLF